MGNISGLCNSKQLRHNIIRLHIRTEAGLSVVGGGLSTTSAQFLQIGIRPFKSWGPAALTRESPSKFNQKRQPS